MNLNKNISKQVEKQKKEYLSNFKEITQLKL